MVDRENVIEVLEKAKTVIENWVPMFEQYNTPAGIDYAIALLKEQETEWEHLWDAPDGTFKGRCKKCGFVHFFIEGHDTQYKYCPECGRRIEWQG